MGAEIRTDWAAAAASALAWWEAAGVDTLVDDLPRDWLAPPAPAPRPGPAVAPAPAAAALPDTLAAFAAWRVSDAAPDANWGPARLAFTGDPASPLLVVTDLPEEEDAASGTLLSGPAGRLFDNMLRAIGLTREQTYGAALAVSRPATARLPETALPELARLARHLVALARPRALLLLGQEVSRALAGVDAARAGSVLHPVNHDGGTIAAAVLLHPRLLLRQPALKAEAWAALQTLKGEALA